MGLSDGSARVFSGENEDGKEYKKWKVWVTNKLPTLDSKVSEKARGAYVYTLLSRKALERVEHLEPSEYQVKDGEQKLFRFAGWTLPSEGCQWRDERDSHPSFQPEGSGRWILEGLDFPSNGVVRSLQPKMPSHLSRRGKGVAYPASFRPQWRAEGCCLSS